MDLQAEINALKTQNKALAAELAELRSAFASHTHEVAFSGTTWVHGDNCKMVGGAGGGGLSCTPESAPTRVVEYPGSPLRTKPPK